MERAEMDQIEDLETLAQIHRLHSIHGDVRSQSRLFFIAAFRGFHTISSGGSDKAGKKIKEGKSQF